MRRWNLIPGIVLFTLMMAAGCNAPGERTQKEPAPASAQPAPATTRAEARAPAPGSQAPQAAENAAEEIGSTRNARVAYAMPADKTVELTFLTGEITEQERAELAKVAPNVRILSGLSRETALAHAAGAHGIDGSLATPELLAAAPNLVWVQAMSAGVDRYMSEKRLVDNDRIVLTNLRAVHGPVIAEHAFAMLLVLTRNMRAYLDAQAQGTWKREIEGADAVALQGKTMLVVGLGGIGSEIAKRAHGFGMRVLATRRSDGPVPDYVERVGKSQDLLAMLPEADVVAVCVPLTAETEGLFGRDAFAAMKKGSYLVNIARGSIVDTEALMAALTSGHLAGAALDVTEPEPLPDGHPLWKLPNVVITPHVSSRGELTDQRRWALLRENLRRFGAGEPLLNVVDKRAGY